VFSSAEKFDEWFNVSDKDSEAEVVSQLHKARAPPGPDAARPGAWPGRMQLCACPAGCQKLLPVACQPCCRRAGQLLAGFCSAPARRTVAGRLGGPARA